MQCGHRLTVVSEILYLNSGGWIEILTALEYPVWDIFPVRY